MRPLLFACLLLASSACVVRVHEPVHRAVAVEEELLVEQTPPAEQVEVIGLAPSASHFWAKGHWMWRASGWYWVGGHWEERRHGYEWVHPHWAVRGRHWVFVPGRFVRP